MSPEQIDRVIAVATQRYRAEITGALQSCGVDPYAACDVDAAAAYMAQDERSNAPTGFWAVVRRFRKGGE